MTIARRSRLLDDVVAQLRDDIVTGRLAAGTRLTQIDLAKRLQVSRTPLREAFRILEQDGLLRSSDNNGTVEVVTVTSDDLREMYELREVIDGLAAKLAARRGLSSDAETRARSFLTEMEESVEPFDPLRRMNAHAEFHELIARESGNHKLCDFLPLIRSSSASLFMPHANDVGSLLLDLDGQPTRFKDILNTAHEQHAEILQAILARDPVSAEAAARKHIQRTIQLSKQIDVWRAQIVASSHKP